MLGNKISNEQGTYIIYQPFFNDKFKYQGFKLDECFDLLNKNNHLIEHENTCLKKHNLNLYLKLLSHLFVLTDAIYVYSIKDNVSQYISDVLEDKLTIPQFKQEIICLITDTNAQIGVELTNFPITFSCYSIIKDVEVKQPNFNGFSRLIKKLFDLCHKNPSSKTFKKEVKLLLSEILQYN